MKKKIQKFKLVMQSTPLIIAKKTTAALNLELFSAYE